MKEEGIGYIIRSFNGRELIYWTGAYKESRWDKSIYMAKLYKEKKTAERAIRNHNEEILWENAEILTIHYKEE